MYVARLRYKNSTVLTTERHSWAKLTRTFSGHVETGCTQQLNHAYTLSVNSRLLDRQTRRHENQTCCDEHMIQSFDGQRQVADDGDRQRRRPGHSNQRDALVKKLRDNGERSQQTCIQNQTSCAACSAAATICPAPCKWWLEVEQPPRAAWWPWPYTKLTILCCF